MWNIFFAGFLLCVPFSHADVSHLAPHHHGYPCHKPDHPLELPQGSSEPPAVTGYPSVVPDNPLQLPDESNIGNTVTGYPRVVPENPLQVPESSIGDVRSRLPDTQFQGTSTGGVLNVEQLHSSHHQGHQHEQHYHGQDGKYNPHDDGSGWDIRKSVPGEPGQDYPVYDSVPSTSFTCKEKVPGYYADEEARCQVFRICTTNSYKTHNSFLCANGSLFNQRSLTCDWWMNVDCSSSSEFYYKNNEIGKMPTGHQLMDQVRKMLQAPNKNPYGFTRQDTQHIDQTITDNLVEGSGAVKDLYLPAKPVTTTTTTQKPIPISTAHKVTTNEFDINQNTFQTSKVEHDENVKETSITNIENKYTPPVVPKVDQSTITNIKTQHNLKIDQSSTSGLTGHDYQKQVPVVTSESHVTNQVANQQSPAVTVTKEQTQTVTHSQKTTHIFQNLDEGPDKISLLESGQNNAQPVVGQNDNKHFIVEQQQTVTGFPQEQPRFQQHGTSVVQTQPSIQTFTGSTVQTKQFDVPELTNEQAFLQIDNIQSGLQQINKQQEQQNVINSGLGVLTPRKLDHYNPAPDFGQNLGFSQFQGNQGFQQTPQGFSHQGVQPNLFAEQNFPAGEYIQNQGYQYSQPNFQEQNLQNFNYHGQQSGANFNVELSKDGSAQNFNGESLSQHSNGHTHSTFSGHNVAFKELTKVDIVPSIGFHLNDDHDKNSYINAVLSGLIHDGPSYQSAGSTQAGQGQFLPSDARFSSYQGPSSYLAPQASVQRLPSDSEYYR